MILLRSTASQLVRRVRVVGAPSPRRYSLLASFPSSVAAHLRAHGHAQHDAALSADTCASLRSEIDVLAARGLLSANHTHMVSASRAAPRRFAKRNIAEAELPQLPAAVMHDLPTLSSIAEDATVPALLSVLWPRLTLTSTAVKVQRAEGAQACFPIHVDSAVEVDRRVVTALLYINEDWDAATDGGALRLYPTPLRQVDVAPAAGRLVLIGSTGLHHRVLPAWRRRYVITLWCSGTIRREKAAVGEWSRVEERAAAMLLTPQFRDMAFRLSLAEEWEQSLREAHGEEEAAEAVRMHRSNLNLIRERIPDALCGALGEKARAATEAVRDMVREPRELVKVWEHMEKQNESALAFQW